LSISSATNKGYTVTFYKNKAFINRADGSVVATASRQGNLYVMCKTRHETQQAAQSNRNDLEKWDARYLNLNDLKKLTTKNMVAGLNLNLNVLANHKKKFTLFYVFVSITFLYFYINYIQNTHTICTLQINIL